MPLIIGIDLGTTFSTVATVDHQGKSYIVGNSDGETVTPSVIFFDGDHIIVGEEAKQAQAMGEEDVAFLFKRNMGDPNFLLEFHGDSYSAQDLSVILLEKLKLDAEYRLGESVTHAVITVPAYFDDKQRLQRRPTVHHPRC